MVLRFPVVVFVGLLVVADAARADTITADAARAADALLALAEDGPDGPDGRPLFPRDLVVVAIDDDAGRVVVDGAFFAGDVLDHERDDLIRETLMGAFDAFGVEGGVAVIDARTGQPLGATLHGPDPQPTTTTRAPRTPPGTPRRKTATLPFGGALVGKRIGISAGHGWLRNSDGSFSTQRSRHTFSASARGIVEDFFSTEFTTNQLVPLLQGMGAELVLIRVPDHDDDAPEQKIDVVASHVIEGTFTPVSATDSVGGSHLRASAEGEGLVRVPLATSPRAIRRVGVRFPRDTQAAAAVVVTVVHAAGSRTFTMEPAGAAGAVVDLGDYPLDGQSLVEFAAAPAVGRVVVDAVEVGGGVHAASEKPWWQMSAAIAVTERRGPGVPSSVTGRGDVTVRPGYAELFDIDAFISIHANASGSTNSTANGLSIYRYNCNDTRFPDHSSSTTATACDDPPGSTELIDDVFASTLGELRATWDPNFGDRGRRVANFGELRELVDTPGILIETAFFDNLENPSGNPPPKMSDNKALHDPRFREAFATGVARGLARFFDATADAPPRRPDGVVVRNVDGDLAVSWAAVPGASGYRVRRARIVADELRAFDEGVVVTGTSAVFADVVPGQVWSVIVHAQSDNGEGYASQAVTARVGPRAALIVDAYDRRDAFVQEVDNRLSHSVEHGAALATALSTRSDGGGVDGALDEAVVAGSVNLADYAFVDVFCGKDSTEHEAVSKALQGRLGSYVDGGGRLFVSGEEIGFHLVERSTDAEDRAFFEGVLGATYVGDDANTFDATLLDVPARLDDGTGGVYEVKFPDAIAAATGATVVGTYAGGAGAMVQKGSVIFLATPLEALVPATTRAAIMSGVVERLGLPVTPLPAEGEGEGEGEGEPGEGEGEGEPGEGEGEPITERLVIQTVQPDGCGCSGGGGPSAPLALLALGLWRRRRRRLV